MSKKKFIVGVIGTQNTGKTTFITDLIERFKGTENEFHTVGCDYRKKIEEAGLSINRNGNLQSQNIILDTLVEQLKIIEGMPDGNYITDRSPIDAYAYTLYLYKHNPELGITPMDLVEQLDKVRDSVWKYDRLIFLDLNNCSNVEVVDDKFRDTDLEYRREIDQLFKYVLAQLGHEFIYQKVNFRIYGNREARVQKFIGLEGGKFFDPKKEVGK